MIALAACGNTSPNPDPDADPLAGSVGCGSDPCGSDQLCVIQLAGIDAGAASYDCKPAPDGCHVADCSDSQCPSCLDQLCEAAGAITVSERTVTCQGI